MKLYSELDPIPSYKGPAWWPVIPAWAFAVALSYFLHTPWRFVGYLPYAVLVVRLVVLVLLRSRRHKRELAKWDQRMQAYYDNFDSQRDKAQWS